MKYILIFVLSFLVFTQALAAKQVSGTVPELKPLQPPPQGVELDYANILNSPAQESSNQGAHGGDLEEQNKNIESADFSEPEEFSSKAGFLSSKNNAYGLVVIGLIILAGGIFYLSREKRRF